MFEQAIKLDPNFTLAHAGIAIVCGMIYEIREKHDRWLSRGVIACDRATALEPGRPEVLAARARIFYAQQKYGEAIAYALMAIQGKPDCEGAYNVLGRAYFASDRFQEAANVVVQAIEASGDDYNVYVAYEVSLRRLGRDEEARVLLERQAKALERQLELVPEDVRARILLAVHHAHNQREEDALRHLGTALALRPDDGNILYNAACLYGLLNKKAEALEMVKRSLKAGYANFEWLRRDPDLACLHDDPELMRLLSEE